MKKCPDCAEMVQDDAKVCRFCRHKFGPSNYRPQAPKTEQKSSNGATWSCIGLVVFIAIIASISGSGDKQSNSAEPEVVKKEPQKLAAAESPYADESKQYAWIAAGKEAIRKQLKDPDSADFRNVHFYSGGGVPVTCGEVNARNGFGGYTGFERFVAAGDVISATESQVEGGLGPVWKKFCVKASWDSV